MLNRHNLSIARFAGAIGRQATDVLHITPKETVATDGSLQVRVTVPKVGIPPSQPPPGITPSNKFSPFSIPSDTALSIERAIPKDKGRAALSHVVIDGKQTDEGDKAVLAVTDMERTQIFQPVKPGKFVDYESVTPKEDEAKFSIDLNPATLARLCESAAKFIAVAGRRENPIVTLRFYADDKAIRLDAVNKETGQDWTAVLMPMRK